MLWNERHPWARSGRINLGILYDKLQCHKKKMDVLRKGAYMAAAEKNRPLQHQTKTKYFMMTMIEEDSADGEYSPGRQHLITIETEEEEVIDF